MSSCSQVCCRSLSFSLELLADRLRSSEHRGWHNLSSTNEGSPSRYRTSHEPRGPSSTNLAPSTFTAPVCRSYRKRTVDLGPDTLFAALSVRHRRVSPGHPERRQGEGYGILLLATDTSRRRDLNVVLYGDRLFQQYVVDSCAKMEQQRLNYLPFNQNSPSWRCLANDGDRAGRRLLNCMHSL